MGSGDRGSSWPTGVVVDRLCANDQGTQIIPSAVLYVHTDSPMFQCHREYGQVS